MTSETLQRVKHGSVVSVLVVWLVAYNGYRFAAIDREHEALAVRVTAIETKVGIAPAVPLKPALTASPVEAILVARCQRCHLPTSQAVAAGFAPALFDRSGAVLEPDKSLRVRIYEVARNGIMPPRKDVSGSPLEPLTDDEFLAVKSWLFPGQN